MMTRINSYSADLTQISSDNIGNTIDIVLCHDYLTQRGGAERVVYEFEKIFKPRQIVVALYSPKDTFSEFSTTNVCPSFLNRFRLFQRDARLSFPFLALCWSLRKPIDADLVFCSSSGWAHGVRTKAGTRKIVYCHNPARWLYQTEDYLLNQPRLVRLILKLFRPMLLRWDKTAAASANVYIANSSSVAQRIRNAYGIEPEIIFPPVAINPAAKSEAVPEVKPPFFLMVGRPRGYKGAQPVIDAFKTMPEHKLVVVGGGSLQNLSPNVQDLGFVSDAQLRWLYSNARALVSVSREDFGLTPIEANAFGTPSLLLRAGGFLDSTIEGLNGMFIDDTLVNSIQQAVRNFPTDWNRDAIKQHAENFSVASFREKIFRVIFA